VHGFVDRKGNNDNYDEARIILGIVRKTRSEQADATIAILVRNRGHAAHILPLLKEAGVPYRAVDLELLQDQAVIQDLMALTQALMHPADRISWLALLRAPWCGLSLVDLEAIANQCDAAGAYPPVLQQIENVLEHKRQPVLETLGGEPEHNPLQNDFFLTQAAGDTQGDGPHLSEDGLQRLTRVLPILRAAQQNKHRKTLRSWVEGT